LKVLFVWCHVQHGIDQVGYLLQSHGCSLVD
jgi:hypothetical protein